jgi:hypothetical protein
MINLGSRNILERQVDRLNRFASALDIGDTSRFERITWAECLDPIIDRSPIWFSDFCRSRRLT